MSNNFSWIKELKEKYDYCSAIEFIPYPSASHNFLKGYMIRCGLYDHYINDPGDCCTCELRNSNYDKK